MIAYFITMQAGMGTGGYSWQRVEHQHNVLFMAFFAVCLVLHIKGALPVVAVPAELTLGDFAHVHLVRIL